MKPGNVHTSLRSRQS